MRDKMLCRWGTDDHRCRLDHIHTDTALISLPYRECPYYSIQGTLVEDIEKCEYYERRS